MPTRFRRFRYKWYYRIPKWVRSNDFELFTIVLCFSAGVPLVLLDNVGSDAINSLLPSLVVKIWGGVLAVAPILVVTGLYKAARPKLHIRDITFWMRIESYGLLVLCIASGIYAIIVLIVLKGGAVITIAITVVFSLTCLTRSAGIILEVEKLLDGLGVSDE